MYRLTLILFAFFVFLNQSELVAQSSPPPRFETSAGAFSPNSDGRQDYLFIRLKGVSKELRTPRFWTISISESGGKTVRVFQNDRRLLRRARSIGNLFLPSDTSVEPIHLFEELVWDGRDDSGRIVVDGVYTVNGQIEGKSGIIPLDPIAVFVDTTSPRIESKCLSCLLVRPADDTGKPTDVQGVAKFQNKGIGPAAYKTQIRNWKGEVIEERDWGDSLPTDTTWNGKTTTGQYADWGTYTYNVIATDAAGNYAEFTLRDISVGKIWSEVQAVANTDFFSPNGDGRKDTIQFTPFYSRRPSRSARLILTIFDSNLQPVYSKEGSPFDEDWFWDGKRTMGQVVPGNYSAEFQLIESGSKQVSPLREFGLDLSKPTVSLSAPSYFLPTDERKSLVKLNQSASDNSPIESFSLMIICVPIAEGKPEKVFNTLQGKRLPAEILWNGISSDGMTVESLEHFEILIQVTDGAGNTSEWKKQDIQSEINIMSLDLSGENLVIRMPDQGYFDKNQKLTSRGESAVQSAISSLSRYPLYKISAEVHSSVVGREEENLDMTEKMAEQILRFLFSMGLKKDRVSYRGIGETEMLFTGDDSFLQYRNRRIEIRLKAKKMERKYGR